MEFIDERFLSDPLGSGKEKKYFTNRKTGVWYRRLVGGIAWPLGIKPGYAVVVAEDFHKDPTFEVRHLHVLDKYETGNILQLIRRCYEFKGNYKASRWYGDPSHRTMMEYLAQFNRDRGSKGLHISDAPCFDDPRNLEFYANRIKDNTKPPKKILHFHKGSDLGNYLHSIPDEKLKKDKADEYPPVAALGYAITALDQPYFDVSKARELMQQHMETYDVQGI